MSPTQRGSESIMLLNEWGQRWGSWRNKPRRRAWHLVVGAKGSRHSDSECNHAVDRPLWQGHTIPLKWSGWHARRCLCHLQPRLIHRWEAEPWQVPNGNQQLVFLPAWRTMASAQREPAVGVSTSVTNHGKCPKGTSSWCFYQRDEPWQVPKGNQQLVFLTAWRTMASAQREPAVGVSTSVHRLKSNYTGRTYPA